MANIEGYMVTIEGYMANNIKKNDIESQIIPLTKNKLVQANIKS